MSERFVFMPGDVVQIDPGACTYDGKEIRHELKGNNFNWVIHSVEDNGCKATMKKYRVFSTTRMWNPPLVVDTKNLKLIEATCRHPETIVEDAIPVTCRTDGKTQRVVCNCKGCKAVLSEAKVIPKTGHQWMLDTLQNKTVCVICGEEKTDKIRNVDLTNEDIKRMIAMIEGILYEPNYVPPVDIADENTGAEPPVEPPYFSDDITFSKEWYKSADNWNYLLYKPSSASPDKLTPLIVWLHGGGEFATTPADFETRGFPPVMANWKLKGFHSYILCPMGPKYDCWVHSTSVNPLFDLINSVVTEYNIDPRKISICGHSCGGKGTEFMTYQRPDYFSCQVILSGYGPENGITDAMIKEKVGKLPTRAYGESGLYRHSQLKTLYGSENVFVVNTDHSGVPRLTFNQDSNNDRISDVFLWMLSQVNEHKEAPKTEPTLPLIVRPVKDIKCYADPEDDSSCYAEGLPAGCRLTVNELKDVAGVSWGKLDPAFFTPSQTYTPTVSAGERWININDTNFNPDNVYAVPDWLIPCWYNGILNTFVPKSTDGSKYHIGIDLQSIHASPVFSATSGQVQLVAYDELNGNHVLIDNGTGYITAYAHLDSVYVRQGDTVTIGQLIGTVGCTGNVTIPHLHFGVKDKTGVWMNPETHLHFELETEENTL